MDGTIIAAIIATSIATIASIVNICLTIHRNNQDGIVSYRIQWINHRQKSNVYLFYFIMWLDP